ncbi:hypothetical protein BOTBODRAFT_141727 [Botryobasidium botryosum FD-172 SS1]|uniref:Uncharacterized protein n=1 Tax=Botryobasidium botryosum (strain FD-172 SS1) TaxID=930990 RepID=A0A067N132_BOTB1|nr:hypothetical protein BOTBODRAFT_141727 [Botryobasidium botryosum FD-172 SS1]
MPSACFRGRHWLPASARPPPSSAPPPPSFARLDSSPSCSPFALFVAQKSRFFLSKSVNSLFVLGAMNSPQEKKTYANATRAYSNSAVQTSPQSSLPRVQNSINAEEKSFDVVSATAEPSKIEDRTSTNRIHSRQTRVREDSGYETHAHSSVTSTPYVGSWEVGTTVDDWCTNTATFQGPAAVNAPPSAALSKGKKPFLYDAKNRPTFVPRAYMPAFTSSARSQTEARVVSLPAKLVDTQVEQQVANQLDFPRVNQSNSTAVKVRSVSMPSITMTDPSGVQVYPTSTVLSTQYEPISNLSAPANTQPALLSTPRFLRSLPKQLPCTPSPSETADYAPSDDSVVFISDSPVLPPSFLRRPISPNSFFRDPVSQPTLPQEKPNLPQTRQQGKYLYVTLLLSPPRPIPALHGPPSLPYARCPSGAEGVVISENSDIPRIVWGLNEHQSVEQGPPMRPPSRPSAHSCTCAASRGAAAQAPTNRQNRHANSATDSHSMRYDSYNTRLRGALQEPIIFGDGIGLGLTSTNVDLSMGRGVHTNSDGYRGMSHTSAQSHGPLVFFEPSDEWVTPTEKAATDSWREQPTGWGQTSRQPAHIHHHRQRAVLDAPSRPNAQLPQPNQDGSSRLSSLLDLLAATATPPYKPLSRAIPIIDPRDGRTQVTPLPPRQSTSTSQVPPKSTVFSDLECLIDMPNDPLPTPPATATPIFSATFSPIIPTFPTTSDLASRIGPRLPPGLPPRPLHQRGTQGRKQKDENIYTNTYNFQNDFTPPSQHAPDGLSPGTPTPTGPPPAAPAAPASAPGRAGSKNLANSRSIPIARLRQKLAPVPEEDTEARNSLISRTPSPLARAAASPGKGVASANATAKPAPGALGDSKATPRVKTPFGEAANFDGGAAEGGKKSGGGGGGRGRKGPRKKQRVAHEGEPTALSAASVSNPGKALAGKNENVPAVVESQRVVSLFRRFC